ncbi:tape measure protein [Chitinophaga sancti]|uniref:Tape measure domain-containing protein n=1 Tax=Chitinophaga sancti TaxID=1004 RepID=A0A1K1LPP4_9BACT|nr:tape measure protein [Chitinophaga sancti]WQD64950.1 tape measure protein [Chitinophaga sancti]WQG89426.1 tape measure protein [Chitinophaga sancti]SFW12839.1 tape measure domain-containing protein [Chitinophaga sancti]
MADLKTITSDTYKDLLKAADAAFSKIDNWVQNTINQNNLYVGSNKILKGSLQQIDDELEKINKKQKETKGFKEFVTIEKRKIEIEEQRKKTQDLADFAARKGWAENFRKVFDSGLDKVIEGGPDLLRLGMAAETAQLSFKQLTGSSSTAAGILKDIHQMAATSLFDNDKLQENAASLLESGVAANKLMPTLSMLEDVSGGNQTKMDSLSKAFGDMQQAGHLTAESLKEMNDAGFKPLEMMAANSGQTMEQLKASMEAGGISTDSVVAALQAATSQGGAFFGVMKEQSETAAGQWHGLQEKMSEAGATVGNALMPTVSNFVENTLKPMVDWLGQAAGWISRNAELVGFLVTVIGGVVLGYKAWTLAAELLGPAMASSGIGAIFVAVGLLIGAVVYAWNTFGWFRGAIMAAWEVLKGFAGMIWDIAIAPIKSLISGISNIGQAVMYLFSGDWDKAWQSGKEAIKDLSGYNTAKTVINDMKEMGGKAADAFNAEVNKKKGQAQGPGMTTPPVPGQGNFGGFGSGNGGGAGANGDWLPQTATGGKSKGRGASGTWNRGVPFGGTNALDGVGTSASWTPDNTRKKMSLDTAKDTATGITNGGARTVNITLQKLVETINITTNTLAESITDMEQQVTDALLHVLKTA